MLSDILWWEVYQTTFTLYKFQLAKLFSDIFYYIVFYASIKLALVYKQVTAPIC